MAFSSFTGGSGARRGGWAGSILPFSSVSPSAKPKHNRKYRRRLAIRDFIFSNFFTIGLLISFFFFLIVLLRYGVPKPISSPFKSHAIRSHRPRKPIVSENWNSEVLSSNVDITTKELYDRIEFLDIDGGPWKQGWKVTYKGNEWDSEKLKVFVVPHSHNDPGWKLTVDEYYDRQSRHILDTIVEALSRDSRRKFIWEEMSYLEKWWRDASDEKKESFAALVKNGQLEIVGGGWVMNDEANSHYFAIIEQMAEGNMWLNETIGVVPKNSWAIDPFGYSPTMAYLLRRMGFENMLIQRTHYELKKELALHKNLEFIWRQSWDAEETTDIFVHMMPFYSYDIPHTCGPEPAICCQFDFARSRGSLYELCPWRQDPVEINKENVQERATTLLDQYRKKSVLYRTNTLLIPLGDDFRYINIDEAEAQFKNYQLLFDYINSNPSLNAEANFGTLEDYFRTLRDEAEKINYSLPGEVGSSLVGGFPSLSGDFFTYADRQEDYWSGYYVSRPFFKAVDRVLERTLRAAEMMLALLLGPCQRSQCEKLPLGFSYKLTAARRNLALFQHHDGVTGTAKDHVVRDYGVRMHTSLQDLHIFMSKAIEVLLGIRHDKSDQNPSQFEPEQMRSKYDAQPVHKSIDLQEGTYQSVIFFNPLEQTREEVAMVIVNRTEVTVLDSNWTCVQSQISPEFQHDKAKVFTGRHRIHWKISVPALGLQTYYIANGLFDCAKFPGNFMARIPTGVLLSLLFLAVIGLPAGARDLPGDFLRLPSEALKFFRGGASDASDEDSVGTRWAVLIAGSNGYWNYRHQADICHAYQLLRKNGLKDENIIVFMYDDIAFNPENPRPGVIINHPKGSDVYHGVPKDYTGEDVTVNNFFAAILGNKTALTGGSGKVVDSGPNDHIFIYYSDHGGPGVLGMPTYPYMYADDLNKVLKKKHAAGSYKSLVFYLEACESGSIFEGLLPEGLNIYTTTASNAYESSWGTYCPGDYPSPPPEYDTCLGDLYSVAWLEDSDNHNLKTESLRQQYELVKKRTLSGQYAYGSHVMQYGDLMLNKNALFSYLGTDPANENNTFVEENSLRPATKFTNQRDADLVHFWEKFRKAPEGSLTKVEAQKKFVEAMSHRAHIDNSVKLVGKLLFGIKEGPEVLEAIRPAGRPLVDDWNCLRNMVRSFEARCGSLSQYGMKHMRSFANLCNAGISKEQMAEASAQACMSVPPGPWSSLLKGFTA